MDMNLIIPFPLSFSTNQKNFTFLLSSRHRFTARIIIPKSVINPAQTSISIHSPHLKFPVAYHIQQQVFNSERGVELHSLGADNLGRYDAA